MPVSPVDGWLCSGFVTTANSLAGPQINLPRLAAFTPLEHEKDFTMYRARLSEIPRYLEQVTRWQLRA